MSEAVVWGGNDSSRDLNLADADQNVSVVYAVIHNGRGFGKYNDDPLLYIAYQSKEAQDATRATVEPLGLTCAVDNHFARHCPVIF